MSHKSDDELWQDLGLLAATNELEILPWVRLVNSLIGKMNINYKLKASYISDYYTTWPKASASERRLYYMQSFTDADALRVKTKLYY